MSLSAPRYSQILVDAHGKPLLLGYFPIVWDPDCPTFISWAVTDTPVVSQRGTGTAVKELTPPAHEAQNTPVLPKDRSRVG